MRYIDYIFESYRKGYCERIIIQAINIDSAIIELQRDYGYDNWYLCLS